MTNVYMHYDQAGLDAAYDNAKKIPAATLQRYRQHWASESERARATIACDLDIAYGAGAGETLDIFRSPRRGLSPVQIYIHGGYWISNDKRDCSYVALAFTGAGFCNVVINYGLVPAVDLHEQVKQCGNALRWVAANIQKYGGDPEQIYVTGHSAGGHLAVMLLADPNPVPPGLKGVTSLSGLYDLEPVRLSFVNEKLSLSPHDVALLSPVKLRPRITSPKVLLTIGANEGDEWIRQMSDLVESWKKALPNIHGEIIPDTDHFSMRAALDDPDSSISRLIWQYMGVGKQS